MVIGGAFSVPSLEFNEFIFMSRSIVRQERRIGGLHEKQCLNQV